MTEYLENRNFRILKRKYSVKTVLKICLIIWIGLLTSCNSTNSVNPVTTVMNPFNNGSNERNMIVVISDLHLGADLAYAEINNNLSYMVKLLEQIRVSSNVKELVIAGDLLDEWFVPANINTYNGKDQADFVRRIAATNKGVIDAFNNIIMDGKISVTYVPGNHDITITAENISNILPGMIQVRDNVLGLGTYSPAGHPEIAIEHGHRYNFFCAPDPITNKDIAPGSILPPGYFFTRIAALHVIQNCKTAADSIPSVTPYESGGESQSYAYLYWNIWKILMLELPIENKFNDKIILTNINGFTETYSINDFLPYQTTTGGLIDFKMFKGIQDTWLERQALNKVAVNVPIDDAIKHANLASFSENQAKAQYFANPGSNKRIVVFGHTHEARIITSINYYNQKSIYANSGTWIDHFQNQITKNFVVITPQNSTASSQTYVKVYNFDGGIYNTMAVDSLRY